MLRRLLERIRRKHGGPLTSADTPAEAEDRVKDIDSPDRGSEHPTEIPPSAQPTAEESTEPPAADGPAEIETLKERVIESIKKVYDPEIPVNIYELGLIYEVRPDESGMVYVKMTLTAPNCPAAGILPGQVESQARTAEGVRDVQLDLVFDPPWTPERMSEAARLELGML